MPVGALDATFSRRTMACLGDLFHYIDCIHAARPGGLGSFSIETLWSATVRPISFLLDELDLAEIEFKAPDPNQWCIINERRMNRPNKRRRRWQPQPDQRRRPCNRWTTRCCRSAWRRSERAGSVHGLFDQMEALR